MSGVNSLVCKQCPHPYRNHDKSISISVPGQCLDDGCDCTMFTWAHYEDDPDQLWHDYKDGLADIDGNYLEPVFDES